MIDLEPARVAGEGGLRGTIEARVQTGPDGQPGRLIRLDDGRQVVVPDRMLTRQEDGSYYLSMSSAQLGSHGRTDGPLTLVVPVIAEEFRVDRRRFETGGVRVTTHLQEREEVVEEPSLREELDIERIPVNREVTAPVSIRYEGDTTIVPLVEEVLVVEKRLMLREEIRITKRRKEVVEPQRVTLRSQDVTVDRLVPGQGTAREL